MDTPRFVNHYSTLAYGMRWCGLASPWIPKPASLLGTLLYRLLYTVLNVIVIYMLCIYVYSLMTIYISFQDLCGLGISTTNYMSGLLVTLYHGHWGYKIKKITDDMDSIAGIILKNELGDVEEYLRRYNKNAKLVALFTLVSICFSSFLPYIYVLSVPVTDFMNGEYRSRFAVKINSPFDDNQPGIYELLLFVMCCCISSTFAKKTATDCLFIALFWIQTDFLEYLSTSMNNLEEEFRRENSEVIKKRLTVWIKLHQKVVENIRELVLSFSPVIIMYYVSVIGNVVCAAFILAKKDNDTIFQSCCMTLYITGALTYLFLLSDAAANLTRKGQEMTFVLYSTSWYKLNKSNADSIKLLMKVTNIPINVTAYRAPVFLLNRETFAGFMATALSAFVTFCQMKDIYDE